MCPRDPGRRHNYEAVGVASNMIYGIKCTGQTVFARVSMYVPWIQKNVDTFVDLHYNYYFDYETVTTIISSVKLIYWMNGNLLWLFLVVDVLTLFIFQIFTTVGMVMFILNYDYVPFRASTQQLLLMFWYKSIVNAAFVTFALVVA